MGDNFIFDGYHSIYKISDDGDKLPYNWFASGMYYIKLAPISATVPGKCKISFYFEKYLSL